MGLLDNLRRRHEERSPDTEDIAERLPDLPAGTPDADPWLVGIERRTPVASFDDRSEADVDATPLTPEEWATGIEGAADTTALAHTEPGADSLRPTSDPSASVARIADGPSADLGMVFAGLSAEGLSGLRYEPSPVTREPVGSHPPAPADPTIPSTTFLTTGPDVGTPTPDAVEQHRDREEHRDLEDRPDDLFESPAEAVAAESLVSEWEELVEFGGATDEPALAEPEPHQIVEFVAASETADERDSGPVGPDVERLLGRIGLAPGASWTDLRNTRRQVLADNPANGTAEQTEARRAINEITAELRLTYVP